MSPTINGPCTPRSLSLLAPGRKDLCNPYEDTVHPGLGPWYVQTGVKGKKRDVSGGLFQNRAAYPETPHPLAGRWPGPAGGGPGDLGSLARSRLPILLTTVRPKTEPVTKGAQLAEKGTFKTCGRHCRSRARRSPQMAENSGKLSLVFQKVPYFPGCPKSRRLLKWLVH